MIIPIFVIMYSIAGNTHICQLYLVTSPYVTREVTSPQVVHIIDTNNSNFRTCIFCGIRACHLVIIKHIIISPHQWGAVRKWFNSYFSYLWNKTILLLNEWKATISRWYLFKNHKSLRHCITLVDNKVCSILLWIKLGESKYVVSCLIK